jgi:hypothetical protein
MMVANVGNVCQYTLSLPNNAGCPGGGSPPDNGGGGGGGGISAGSVFLILFFVGGGVYVIAGCIYKRQKMGATGVESCPNVDFWREIPGLVKDGCKFTWQKLRALCSGGATSGGESYDPLK